jgi:hypothetical protein
MRTGSPPPRLFYAISCIHSWQGGKLKATNDKLKKILSFESDIIF